METNAVRQRKLVSLQFNQIGGDERKLTPWLLLISNQFKKVYLNQYCSLSVSKYVS